MRVLLTLSVVSLILSCASIAGSRRMRMACLGLGVTLLLVFLVAAEMGFPV